MYSIRHCLDQQIKEKSESVSEKKCVFNQDWLFPFFNSGWLKTKIILSVFYTRSCVSAFMIAISKEDMFKIKI